MNFVYRAANGNGAVAQRIYRKQFAERQVPNGQHTNVSCRISILKMSVNDMDEFLLHLKSS